MPWPRACASRRATAAASGVHTVLQAANEILNLAPAHFRLGVVERRLAVQGAGGLAQPGACGLLVAVVQLGGETKQPREAQHSVAVAGVETLAALTAPGECRD